MIYSSTSKAHLCVFDPPTKPCKGPEFHPHRKQPTMHPLPIIRFAKVYGLLALVMIWDWKQCSCALSSSSSSSATRRGIQCGVCEVAALERGTHLPEGQTELKPTGELVWRSCGSLFPEPDEEAPCSNSCQVAKYRCSRCQVLAYTPLDSRCPEHGVPPIRYEDENKKSSRLLQPLFWNKLRARTTRGD
ncbi:hypothetical protein PGT21_004071 [Puccinia graminis f. sp. tritici]|uniref:Uncharacterized protein n=1 Tax=Puccinia graminis f. sp. tritici TaxID=56615 RepID=A0A5B0Q1V9_PUCGR|nr:hypothetical protein PGT21_004071 [Puccinia graminis f. sp. tritici]KAA1137242.1 hypothetical protein PGTUg99_010531 [Puccinia graminis f. sp. tritici]